MITEQVKQLMNELVRRSCVAISAQHQHDHEDVMSVEEALELMYPNVTPETIQLCSHYDGEVLYEFDLEDLDGSDDEIRKKIHKKGLLEDLKRLNHELRDIERMEKMLERRKDIESRIQELKEKLNG